MSVDHCHVHGIQVEMYTCAINKKYLASLGSMIVPAKQSLSLPLYAVIFAEMLQIYNFVSFFYIS
jgi:hypothetical protein